MYSIPPPLTPPPPANATDERWAAIRPWITALRGRLQLVDFMREHVRKRSSLKINLIVPFTEADATPSVQRAIRDALLLLRLVQSIDPEEWVHVVTMDCGMEAVSKTDLLELCCVGQVSFRLFLYDASPGTPDNWVVVMLMRLIDGQDAEEPHEHKLSETMEQLAALAGCSSSPWEDHDQLDILIDVFVITGRSAAFLRRLWSSLKASRARHASWSFPARLQAPNIPKLAFKLHSLRLVTQDGVVNDDLALVLGDIIAQGDGLRVSELCLAVPGSDPDTTRLYDRIISGSGAPKDSQAKVKKLDLTFSPSSPSEFERLCSAIAGSQTVERLSLHLDSVTRSSSPEMRLWIWERLTPALFLSRKRSSITSVVITGFTMSEADSGAAAAALETSAVGQVTSPGAQPVKTVTSLKLECFKDGRDSVGSVCRLLRLVGASLTSLSLDLESEFDHSAVAVDQILSLCPSLTSLAVRDSTISIRSLLDAYKEQDLRLEELFSRVDDFRRLMDELSDSTSRLTRTLKRLSCRVDTPATSDVTQAVVAMLEANKLEYLHVYMRQLDFDMSGGEDIQRFHGQVIAVVGAPLPLECRVAFLSILRSSASRLDRRVLSLIFSFAATCASRRVYVTLYED